MMATKTPPSWLSRGLVQPALSATTPDPVPPLILEAETSIPKNVSDKILEVLKLGYKFIRTTQLHEVAVIIGKNPELAELAMKTAETLFWRQFELLGEMEKPLCRQLMSHPEIIAKVLSRVDVNSAGTDSTDQHICHAHNCTNPVSPSLLACRPHWYSLRDEMKRAVWAEYAAGQETRKDPSIRYLAVQARAVAEIAMYKPKRAKTLAEWSRAKCVEIAAPYFLNSERLRKEAVAAGKGDPLAFCQPFQSDVAMAIRTLAATATAKLT